MRQRITYIRDARQDDSFTPDNIQVSGRSLSVNKLAAAKEHRLTIGLSELPDEIIPLLELCHELHLRWSSPQSFRLPAPFSSRVSPGVHIYITPLEGAQTEFICPILQDMVSWDIKCRNHEESFTSPPILSERFSTTASSQLYTYIPSLEETIVFIDKFFCDGSDNTCRDAAMSLLTASSFDVDYDVISRVLVVTAYWDQGPDDGGVWNDKISKASSDGKIEVGILNEEKAAGAEDLSLGGWLTVLGDDKEPKPTLFSFPSRHHDLPVNATQPAPTFNAAFDKPTGLHPILRLTFHNSEHLTPPAPSCALHAYLTLPSKLFIDRHAFSDPLFLAAHNLASLRAISGATDLEAPEWAVDQWGSAILLELSPPAGAQPRKHHNAVTIPLHARYRAPTPGGQRDVAAPWPAVFWACAADEGAKFPVNPFDRKDLGYDGLFGDRTLFYHVLPVPVGGVASSRPADAEPRSMEELGMGEYSGVQDLVSVLTLPVLDADKSEYVEIGTVVTVLVGFLWVCWALFGPVASRTAVSVGATSRHGKNTR